MVGRVGLALRGGRKRRGSARLPRELLANYSCPGTRHRHGPGRLPPRMQSQAGKVRPLWERAGSHGRSKCAGRARGRRARRPRAQVWVYGNSFENVLVAVVVPSEPALNAWAERERAAAGGDFAALCRSDAARAHVLSELTATGKEGRLKARRPRMPPEPGVVSGAGRARLTRKPRRRPQGFEAVKAIHLEPEQFTVEAELMTPTFKLKRPQLQKKYQAVIDGLYAALR